MNKINTGGAAFPQVNLKDSHGMLVPDRQEGMTLRDYFAAKAMQEMTWKDKQGSAKECYEIADAMLKVRDV